MLATYPKRAYLVYSAGKCGSSTIAFRIPKDTSFTIDSPINRSERIEHNVCHLHLQESLKSILTDTAEYEKVVVIYPFRNDLLRQAMSSYFQWLKLLPRRVESVYTKKLAAADIRDPAEITDTNFSAVYECFQLYLEDWITGSGQPLKHISNFMNSMNFSLDAPHREYPQGGRIFFENQRIRIGLIRSDQIDANDNFFMDILDGMYKKDQGDRNKTEYSKVARYYRRLQNEYILRDDLKRFFQQLYATEPFVRLLDTSSLTYL